MAGIAEHAFEYEERVAAVFQSQELLSKNISEVLTGAIRLHGRRSAYRNPIQ